MTENELELIRLIRNSKDPGTSLMSAATIIIGFLKQLESSEAASAAYLLEHA